MLLDNVTNRTPSPLGAIFFFEPDFEHCQARCMCDYQVFKDRTVHEEGDCEATDFHESTCSSAARRSRG